MRVGSGWVRVRVMGWGGWVRVGCGLGGWVRVGGGVRVRVWGQGQGQGRV